MCKCHVPRNGTMSKNGRLVIFRALSPEWHREAPMCNPYLDFFCFGLDTQLLARLSLKQGPYPRFCGARLVLVHVQAKILPLATIPLCISAGTVPTRKSASIRRTYSTRDLIITSNDSGCFSEAVLRLKYRRVLTCAERGACMFSATKTVSEWTLEPIGDNCTQIITTSDESARAYAVFRCNWLHSDCCPLFEGAVSWR